MKTLKITPLLFTNFLSIDPLTFHSRQGTWLAAMLPLLSADSMKLLTLQEVQDNYEAAGLEDFELFWENKPMNTLYKAGLLVI